MLDLFVTLEARSIGALIILTCDEARRPRQPLQIGEIPRRPPADTLPIYWRTAATVGGHPA